MNYDIQNDKELDAFLNRHVRELGHTATSTKRPPPPWATYSDGKPILNDINMSWVCSCGEHCEIIWKLRPGEEPPKLREECARLDQAVDIFAQHMKDKLHKKAAEGFARWDDPAFEPIIRGKFLERAHRLHAGDDSQAIDVANLAMMLFTQALYADCICCNCAAAGHNGGDEQCACDGIPVFDAVRCGACKHKAACDVALNPQLYPDATRGEEAT